LDRDHSLSPDGGEGWGEGVVAEWLGRDLERDLDLERDRDRDCERDLVLPPRPRRRTSALSPFPPPIPAGL
ncbi:MAG TPA: hypothetical protein VEM76_08800, partial [Anaeromyxobacteraceae bacterium]|nr:hypothetical protein [Anaeromyxobacteraceae bacterium]